MGFPILYFMTLMKKLTLLFLLFITFIHAQHYSFDAIEQMPKSIAKDYYTWRFLQESNTTKKEALLAYQWTKRKSYKLKKAIRKKVGYLPVDENKKKIKKDPKNYIIHPATAAKKSKKSLRRLYRRILKQGKYSDVLKVMADKKPFEALATLSAQAQCYIFNSCKTKYRKKYFNHEFSKEQLQLLVKEKQFNTTVHKIITTHALQKTKKSLTLTPADGEILSFKTLFLLGINAVEFNELSQAKIYFELAKTKTEVQGKIDQSHFWLYLISKDKNYLEELLKSSRVNIYTLRARDILNKPYPKVITPRLGMHLVADIDPYSPIDWEKIRVKIITDKPQEVEKLAEGYKSYMTEGIYSFLKEKASGYNKPYYAMPYLDVMMGLDKKRVALLYAIGRQESRFVPASVSTSYALGMMQIMPFLIKHLAKERGEKLDLDEMFNPYVALDYANQHLNYLNRHLYHPLFVAYAYNGGIGFTRRSIRSKHLFKTGKYEPYLSMELIDFEESKEYGKKVLTNYVIYMNQLGIKTKLSPLLQMLAYPSQTDRFRK